MLKYRLEIAAQAGNWTTTLNSSFDNRASNPVEQFIVPPKDTPACYRWFTSVQDAGNSGRMQVAKIGIITKDV